MEKGETIPILNIVMVRIAQILWGWVFLTQEKPVCMEVMLKWHCHSVPPQSCFSLLPQSRSELAQGMCLAKKCLQSVIFLIQKRVKNFSQLNERMNNSLIIVLAHCILRFPIFLNIALISSTTFSMFSFQKTPSHCPWFIFEPETCPLIYSVSTQVNVPTLKSTCILSGLGHHVFPWNAGSVSAWIMLNIPWTSILGFKLQRKYWFSAWLIDKFLPHCLPLTKACVTGFLEPQEESLISFQAELSWGQHRWLLHPSK